MSFNKSEYIWFDGAFVPWDEAKVHVLSHALHYGSSVFEGIRCYDTATGPAIFCLEAHVKRMVCSCRIYRMELPYSPECLSQAIVDTVARNKLRSCYIRPLAFRGYAQLGVEPRSCPVQVIIAAWDWGAYLGAEALEQGVDVGVSSWRRMAPDTTPAAAKVGGHYANSQLIRMEAAEHGYAEGIALDIHGYVSEGSGENVFLVQDGVLYTPPLSASVLAGITRSCTITLARELGYEVRETMIPREQLYMADEVFFTGTAAELTPIRSVDRIVVGQGCRGPVTTRLQDEFFKIVSGRVPDRHHWLTPVPMA
ncbi:MAG TPA: branched-chain amino acid transaminase [Chloroflexi bacterium]|jgi:branched-chain amino acid aminotransferase|nr:branched-chain amino acid transaminase [Chloroflexota bacterium]